MSIFNGNFAFLACKNCGINYWESWVLSLKLPVSELYAKARLKFQWKSDWVGVIESTCHQSTMPNNVLSEAFSKESTVTFEWALVPR
jgi:hypothetical protein